QGSRGMRVGKECGFDKGVTHIVALRKVLCVVVRRRSPIVERDVERNIVAEKNVVEIACSVYGLCEGSLCVHGHACQINGGNDIHNVALSLVVAIFTGGRS